MSGNHPFAINSLKSVSVRTKSGNSIAIHPWNYNSASPLISLTIDENIFNPLISGTMIIRDIGDWSNEIDLKAFDEIDIGLNLRINPGSLGGSETGSISSSSTLSFEITNVKETVNLANQAFQNASETTKAVTLNFVSKNVLSTEFLSSVLEDENFIGPIAGNADVTFQDNQSETPTSFTARMKGFDSYINEKLQLNLDAEKTLNFCYLKRNNVSYPWGKLKGQPTILQTLQYLAENAVSSDNDKVVNYLFWQDFYGFHFRSINSLIKENENSTVPVYDFNDNNLYPTSIISFETITEFDALNILNSDAYFSWYERITPDFEDPYIDFIDSTDALKTSIVSYDIREEYDQINHIEGTSILSEDIDSTRDDNYDKFSENQRKDDSIYGFFSQNRYNTPFPQKWDYLGISCDSRLTNVVWQNQFDIDNVVNPEIIYLYEKEIKKKQHENRKKYVDLKNAKKKWEVYRCALCCTNQIGGTADQKLIGFSGASANSADYVYYFGPTGIFKDISSDQYGVAAAGGFSDVVNYIKGLTAPGGTLTNGLTLAYNLNEAPYNETIEQFYYLKKNLNSITTQIDSAIQSYNNELTEIDLYIPRITSLLSDIPSWIISATDLAYNNLTPDFYQTCSYDDLDPNEPSTVATNGPGTGQCSCMPFAGGFSEFSDDPIYAYTAIDELNEFWAGELYLTTPRSLAINWSETYLNEVGFYYKNSGPNFKFDNDWENWKNGHDFGGLNSYPFIFGAYEQKCECPVPNPNPFGNPTTTPCRDPIPKAPLYVNLTYHTQDMMILAGAGFRGYYELLFNVYDRWGSSDIPGQRYLNVTARTGTKLFNYSSSIRKLYEKLIQEYNYEFPIPPKLSGEAWELPFQKPAFLYNCTRSKLITGNYYRTTENLPTPSIGSGSSVNIGNFDSLLWKSVGSLSDFTSGEGNFLDPNKTLSDVIDENLVWCDTCLDPIKLKIVELEYKKVLKQLNLRKYVISALVTKLSTFRNKIENLYNEYMDRKAFFISKNPFDPETPGNILNKKSQVSLSSNIKSIKRKPIRGSKYEILAKRVGITSGAGQYIYNIFFDNDQTRLIGITGNHPYYDQKYRGFSGQSSPYPQTYATREAFVVNSYGPSDIVYYDNYYIDLWKEPIGTREVGIQWPVDAFGDYDPWNPGSISGYLFIPRNIILKNNLGYPGGLTPSLQPEFPNFSYTNTTSKEIVNQESKIFQDVIDKKPPSLKKEEIDSFVRIEFTEPIGLDRLADFPTGFVRDAGSEYFLPYIVQLTAGPHGRQSIQSNVAVIGMDPYGFDVAVKKIKSKNNYNDYKEWGYYWWHQPLNKLKVQNKTKDISDMNLWSEKSFENEYTFYQGAGSLFYDIGSDYTEYHDYVGALTPTLYTDYSTTEAKTGLFWSYSIAGSQNTDYADTLGAITPSRPYYTLPIKKFDVNEKLSGSYGKGFIDTTSIQIDKRKFDRTLTNTKYGSYNLLSSHNHTNIRRSWFDFQFPSKVYFDTTLQNLANINNLVPGFVPATLLKGFDFVNFSGDGLTTVVGGLDLKSNQQLISFLNSIEMDSLVHDNTDIPGDDLISPLSKDSFTKLNGQIQQIFSDDIEHLLNADFMIYKPGLLTKDVWKYDIFGETEYGMTKPPTLPAEYDSFDNNFSAQFIVFSKTESTNICKELNIKCINPNGYVDLSNCPENDPYCNCGGKSVIPKVKEPTYKEIAIAFEETKECKLIEQVFGKEFLGCIISDDKNVVSCGCPEQGKHFNKLLAALRTSSTFYKTPPETPLRRNAQMMMMNSQRAMMAIYPNDQLRVGSMVEIRKENPTFGHRNRQQRVSGKWLITGISRQFKSNNIEMMVVALARDSYSGSNGNSPITPGRDIF